AKDISRFLADRPVIARQDTLAYRSIKFIRRNRVGVLAAALIALSLLVGIVAALWRARRANEQRVRAERLLYTARMNLAYQAWEISKTGRTLEPLNRKLPNAVPRA